MLTAPHTWIELNAALFNHNVSTYRSLLGPKTILSAVIKSNGYGHGAQQMGILCDAHPDINMLCTSNLSEALNLRALGIKKPILVLGFIDDDPRAALYGHIIVPIHDIKTLHELNRIGAQEQQAFKVHVKIDTGMSRFGFYPDQALSVLAEAHQMSHIHLDGIFTHCAEPNNQEYTRYQLDQFATVCAQADAADIPIPHRHAANSAVAGAFMDEYPMLNMARIGAGIYGFWHSDSIQKQIKAKHPAAEIHPILSWKTRIGSIREIPAHTPVSYDRTYVTTRHTKIAVLPVGYYESYDRKLYTHDRFVLVKDRLAPVLGRVCMNATIIDITDIPDAQVHDEVVLIGNHPHIRAVDLVTLIGNANPREVITRLVPTIQRIIVPELSVQDQVNNAKIISGPQLR